MKISKARLNEIIKEELADILSEIKAEDIGLDSKKDTTEADDDLLGLISKKELAANKDYAIMLKNGYIPVNRFGVDRDAPAKGEHLTAKLGRSGAFGTAYEATKAGTNKRFAVKLTSDSSELKVRRKLEQLRDKVGNEVSKHIVKVYDIIEAKGEPARQPGESGASTQPKLTQEILSGTEKLYHGNRKGDFPPEHRRFAGAIFLTSNLNFAKAFAGVGDDENVFPDGTVWEVTLKPGLNICNPLDPATMKKLDLKSTIQQLIDSNYVDKTNETKFRKIGVGFKGYDYDTDKQFDIQDESQSVYHYLWRVKNGAWRIIECEPIVQKIKANYDGFYVVETGAKNVAIFDESSIKSFNKIYAAGDAAAQSSGARGELKEADKPFDAGRLQGTVPGRRSAFLKDLPMKHMIVMQLVRPMNDFEDKLLYDGMGSLERLLTSYKIKEIAGNWELFLNLLKGRIDEDGFDFAAALAAIIKRAPKRSTPVDRDIYAQFKFHETVANQLLTVCREQSAKLRNIWKDSFKNLSIAGGKFKRGEAAYHAYEAALKNIGPHIAKLMISKNRKFYEDVSEKLALGPNGDLTNPEILFNNIIDGWESFVSGLQYAFNDYVKNKLGSEPGEFKMTRDFAEFVEWMRKQTGSFPTKQEILVNLKKMGLSMPGNVYSFISALVTLAVEHRVEWNDLHPGNVMINPETGDYLAVDVGMFDIH